MAHNNPLNGLQTEERNSQSTTIDKVSTERLCRIINTEDATVAYAVEKCIPVIAAATDALTSRVRQGGRVIYVGAGTSGRLGVLDASEIPPTFSASPEQFVGRIAGGDTALRSAIEGAEDSPDAAVRDLEVLHLDGDRDSLIGIAASGRTPYVLGSLIYAKAKGCITVGVACSAPSAMSTSGNVDFMINALTGPEVVTGSTRMKSGTATKLVLNMISTGIMIKVGKTFGNIMVDVKPTNIKLQHRARSILREICGERCPTNNEDLDSTLESCNKNVKLAAVVISLNVPVTEAQRLLDEAGGVLALVLERAKPSLALSPNAQKKIPHYLCVDAGGSKCAAVILSENGIEGTGFYGTCNATEIGIDAAVSQINLAVLEAIEDCNTKSKSSMEEICIASAWIALAGGDRNGLKEKVHIALQNTLPLCSQASVRVTNDIELLATISGRDLNTDNVIVLVAGTGSIAMTYQRSAEGFTCVDRSGGFGAFLGDQGSGFAIGREAIRFALMDLENHRRTKYDSSGVEKSSSLLDPLTLLILSCYGPAEKETSFDLLNSVLVSNLDDGQQTSKVKHRIASSAESIVEASGYSNRADAIVKSAQESLVDLLRNLLMKPGVNVLNSALVVSGGLMHSNAFREGFESSLKAADIHFPDVVYSQTPARSRARLLRETA